MGYKAKFSGLEVYSGDKWHAVKDPDAIDVEELTQAKEPISQQVAQINLPDHGGKF